MCCIMCSAPRRNYAFATKPHDDLGGALGFMDFEAAAKTVRRRVFVVLKEGAGAAWSVRFGQFMLDLHTNEHGLHRDQSAAAGQGRSHVRHHAIAEI